MHLALKDASDTWVYEPEIIKQMVREFFMNIYCSDHCYTPLPISGGFPSVDRNDWDFIYRLLIVDEIRDTLFHMGSLKAPGSDGLHALFFYSQ